MGRAWGTLCRSYHAIIAEIEKRRTGDGTIQRRESVKDIERSLEGLDMIEGDPRERRGRSIEVKREERRQGGLLY